MVQVQVELVPKSVSTKGGMKKTVQTTPGMVMVEILIKACSEMQVDPGMHVLRHKKKEVDLTLPFRLANLSNNAMLELFELEPTVASKRMVSVSLQCEGGKRANLDAGCGSNLLDLLGKFEDRLSQRLYTGCRERGETPCVNFMNKTFEGEDILKATTLLQLGVVQGSALLRHSLKRDTIPEGEVVEPAKPHQEEQVVEQAAQKQDDTMEEEPSKQPAETMEVEASHVAQNMVVKAERQWIVGRPREDGGEDASMIEVDDDLFEITTQDLMTLEEIRKKKEKDTNMFKTRYIREIEREAKLSKFSECGVRVMFPDQTWVQVCFSVMETLADIYTFVRSTLAQERPFYLYTTPPPTKLPDSKDVVIKYTQLLPSARVYFSFSQPPAGEPPFMAFKYIEKMEEMQAERAREAAARKSRLEQAEAAAAQTKPAEELAGSSAVGGTQEEGDKAAGSEAVGGSSSGTGSALEAAEKRAASNQARGTKQPKWFKMK